jgi:outer membrane protein OmpA-like peptidoglycan-associated protein/tetratricopeptide (TPR) repeat protein
MMLKQIIIFSLLFCTNSIFAQDDEEGTSKLCVEIDNKKALKLYEKATDKKKYKKPERLAFLRECLAEEPDFAEANMAMAREIVVHSKLENKSFAAAVPFFLKAIAVCPQIHSEAYYYIGFNYYEETKNDSAIKYLQQFIKFKDEDEKKFSKTYEGEIYQAKEMVKFAKKESELKKKVVPFDPKVVTGISTKLDEYLAYISPDDKVCFFARKVPLKSMNTVKALDGEKEVFMIAKRDNTGKFNAGEQMSPPFNTTDDNQGGCTISIDNKLLYFAMSRFEGGNQPNVDIYVSKNEDEYWSEISKIGANVNHPVYWDSQPTLSADGNSLYFASDRPGGYGGIDIYVTKKDPKTGVWGVPQNVGPKINTRGDEKTPFIHSDSETLYFSSGPGSKSGEGGWFGFGGMDIFFIRKNDKAEWLEAENIGYPINTEADDVGFLVSTDSKTGYFFSYDEGKMRGKGVGRYDLYSFDLYKEARPQETTFMTIEMKDKSGNRVEGAKVEVMNTVTKEKTLAVVDSVKGTALVAVNLKKKDDLLITVKKDDYAFSSKVVSIKDASFENRPKPVKIEVNEAASGSSFVLNNLYYNTNSADLKKESFIVLESFADYLKENPNIKIEIQGHTDNVGAVKANEALSANRAYTVKAFLEEKGVEGKRITAKGFGPNKPIAENTTEDGKAKNRRTEFLITAK